MKYLRIPVEPTRDILYAMRCATFLTDGSDTEMHRRYNGLIAKAKLLAINKRRRRAPRR